LNFPFFIAKRYLVSKKSNNAINIISGISIGGICIGTVALVIVLSAFNGLADLVQSLYNSFDPDIKITIKQGKTFDPYSAEIYELKKIDGIAFYTEVVEGNALLKFDDKQTVATIKGVSKDFNKMSGFDTLIHEGRFDLSKNNIVIGKGIGFVLNTGPQELFTPISVFAPKRGNMNSINPEEGLNELKVYPAGAFSINDEFDYNYAIMNIDKARILFDYTNEVTSLELGIKKSADKEKVQQEIEKVLGDKYEVKNREQQNALLYKTIKSEKLWTFIILVFILIIATFNIIGCLTMLIIEKKKDITIMHNMGADIKLIRKIFLMEGMLITIVGALSGLILGTLICWLQIKFSFVKFNEGIVVDAYPISFRATDYLWISVAVLLIGFIAAWYPVRIFTKKHLAV
jgi:lipoprotein-releasing system permease protein